MTSINTDYKNVLYKEEPISSRNQIGQEKPIQTRANEILKESIYQSTHIENQIKTVSASTELPLVLLEAYKNCKANPNFMNIAHLKRHIKKYDQQLKELGNQGKLSIWFRTTNFVQRNILFNSKIAKADMLYIRNFIFLKGKEEQYIVKVVHSEKDDLDIKDLKVPDGWIYTGPVLNGLPHGHGVAYLQDSTKYEGEFVMGKMTDIGTRSTPIGNNGIYEGAVNQNNKFHGKGRFDADDFVKVIEEPKPIEYKLKRKTCEFFGIKGIYEGTVNQNDEFHGKGRFDADDFVKVIEEPKPIEYILKRKTCEFFGIKGIYEGTVNQDDEFHGKGKFTTDNFHKKKKFTLEDFVCEGEFKKNVLETGSVTWSYSKFSTINNEALALNKGPFFIPGIFMGPFLHGEGELLGKDETGKDIARLKGNFENGTLNGYGESTYMKENVLIHEKGLYLKGEFIAEAREVDGKIFFVQEEYSGVAGSASRIIAIRTNSAEYTKNGIQAISKMEKHRL